MLKDFFNTLVKVIHLRSIIGYNGLVFALRKTPVIGKLIPDRLYSTAFLKIIYWVIHVVAEVCKLFAGKIFGLGMIYLISFFLKTEYLEYNMASGVSGSALYAGFAMSLFVVYALYGILLNIPVFRCTPEKEYLVFMIRMNPRKLNNTLFIYDLAKLVIGYQIAGIVAVVTGCPFWVWLGIPVLAVFIKLFGTGVLAFSYRIKNDHHKPLKSSALGMVFRIVTVILSAPVVLMFIANGHYVPLHIVLIVCAVLILLGIRGLSVLMKFDAGLHRRALRDNIVKYEELIHKEPDKTKSFKRLKAKGSVKGNKKGFEYLNALFVKRHSGMLMVKPIAFAVFVLVLLGLLIAEFIYGYYQQFGGDNCIRMVMNNLLNMILFKCYDDPLLPFEMTSVASFFRWLVQYHLLGLVVLISGTDNSGKSTQAMYINCDNSLMTFSFFKQRDKIIKLFDIRLKQLIKINIIPALAFALAANLILFYTGGQDYPFQYLATFVVASSLSIIYSTIWLSLYYLFQPYTTSVNVKGGMYKVVSVITAIVFMILFFIPCNSLILAGILAVFTVIFVLLMRKAVYKHAPETWKLKV